MSPTLFAADFRQSDAATLVSHVQSDASDAGFDEAWLQRAIAANPELVIAACREAKLTDEVWAFWAREVRVDPVGVIDVVLVSTSGRIGLVETKLSYNREARRSVVAQTLEYAIHFPTVDAARLPATPEVNGRPLDDAAVQQRIREGDYLLIVAGDDLDDRAVKLGRSMLGQHLVHGWTLAMVEVSVYRPAEVGPCLLVPHVRGAIVPEQRQVVRIIVEGDRTRVAVDQTAPVAGATSTGAAPPWDEARFRAHIGQSHPDMASATDRLISIAKRFGMLDWKAADFRGTLGKLNVTLPLLGQKPLFRLYSATGALAVHVTAVDKSASAKANRQVMVDRLRAAGFIPAPSPSQADVIDLDFTDWSPKLDVLEAALGA